MAVLQTQGCVGGYARFSNALEQFTDVVWLPIPGVKPYVVSPAILKFASSHN